MTAHRFGVRFRLMTATRMFDSLSSFAPGLSVQDFCGITVRSVNLSNTFRFIAIGQGSLRPACVPLQLRFRGWLHRQGLHTKHHLPILSSCPKVLPTRGVPLSAASKLTRPQVSIRWAGSALLLQHEAVQACVAACDQ